MVSCLNSYVTGNRTEVSNRYLSYKLIVAYEVRPSSDPNISLEMASSTDCYVTIEGNVSDKLATSFDRD